MNSNTININDVNLFDQNLSEYFLKHNKLINMKNLKILIMSIFLMSIVSSCSDNDDVFIDSTGDSLVNTRSQEFQFLNDEKKDLVYEGRQLFAETLLEAFKSNRNFGISLRQLFIDSYAENGGELLYQNIKDEIMFEESTLESVLKSQLNSENASFAQSYFDDLAKNDPLLTIDIPGIEGVANNDWDDEMVPRILYSQAIYKDNQEKLSYYTSERSTGEESIYSLSPVYSLLIKTSELHIALYKGTQAEFSGGNFEQFFTRHFPNPCQALLDYKNELIQTVVSGSGEDWMIVEINDLRTKYQEFCIEHDIFIDTDGGTEQNGQEAEYRDCEDEEECRRDCDDEVEYLWMIGLRSFGTYESIRCGTQKRIDLYAVPTYHKSLEEDLALAFPGTTISKVVSNLGLHKKDLFNCNWNNNDCTMKYNEFHGQIFLDDWKREDFEYLDLTFFGKPDNGTTTTVGYQYNFGFTFSVDSKSVAEKPATPTPNGTSGSPGIPGADGSTNFGFQYTNSEVTSCDAGATIIGNHTLRFCEESERPYFKVVASEVEFWGGPGPIL